MPDPTAPALSNRVLLSLGIKNLARHRRRAVANAASVAACVGIAAFFLGFYRGSYDELLYGTVIDYQTAHAQIQAPGFDDDDPDSFVKDGNLIGRWEERLAGVRGVPGVVAAAPRLIMSGFAGDGRDRFPVLVSGIEPEAERTVGVAGNSIVEGAGLGAPGSLLVGESFARLFGLAPGSRCVVQVWTAAGAPNVQSFAVSGIFRTSFAPLDRSCVYMRLEDAQELSDAGDAINKIFVKCESTGAVPRIFPGIRERAAGLDAKMWTHYAATLIEHTSREANFYVVFLAILFALSVSTVATTMYVNVFERTREIGTLRAMGWERGEVFRLFLLESAAVGIVGSAAGLAVGGAASWALAAFPIDLRSMGEAVEIPFFEVKSSPAWSDFAVSGLLGILAAAAAGSLPARKAARAEIVRALAAH